MPLLMEAVNRTTGPIAELGAGWFSTPLLHWMCAKTERRLVSYETSPNFAEKAEAFREPWHEIRWVPSWDYADLEQPWGLAFVDHKPGIRRKEDIRRLADWAQAIVAHDTCGRTDKDYRYSEIWHLFKWRADYQVRPKTTVVSNFVDVSGWAS